MHQIQFRLGSAADPAGVASALPNLVAGFKGPFPREGRGRVGNECEKGDDRGWQGMGGEIVADPKGWFTHPCPKS